MFGSIYVDCRTQKFNEAKTIATVQLILAFDFEVKHEYLRSRAYICLSLSSPFPSVTVVQL